MLRPDLGESLLRPLMLRPDLGENLLRPLMLRLVLGEAPLHLARRSRHQLLLRRELAEHRRLRRPNCQTQYHQVFPQQKGCPRNPLLVLIKSTSANTSLHSNA